MGDTLPGGFPKTATTLSATPRYESLRLAQEIRFQTSSITFHTTKLRESIFAFRELNHQLWLNDREKCLSIASRISADFGYSFLLLRKLAFIQANSPGDDKVNEYINNILGSGLPSYLVTSYIALYEQFDTDDDEWRMYTKWQRKTATTKARWLAHFIESLFWTVPPHADRFSSHILTLGTMSAIDGLYGLMSLATAYPEELPAIGGLDVTELLPAEIVTAWNEAFSDPALCANDSFRTRVAPFQSPHLLRAAMAFREYPSLNRWRAAIDSSFYDRIVNKSANPLTFTQTDIAPLYFGNPLTLSDLCGDIQDQRESLDRYRDELATSRTRTAAVMYCLHNGDAFSRLGQDSIRILLSRTTRLSELLTEDELRSLYEQAKGENQIILSYLFLCMLYWAKPDDDLNHTLRMEFQAAVKESFEGDIIGFLRWLAVETPEIAETLVYSWDLGFLEKLYLLVPSYDSALQLQARIHAWFGEHFNRPEYLESSKRIETDLKVRELKKQIDDTRLFIDETRFRLWIEEFLGDTWRRITLTQIFQSAPTISTDLRVSKGKLTDVDGFGGIDHWVLSILQQAFQEFCENKLYGISSFLGRRIRHGTLLGFLYSPVHQLFEDPEYESLSHDEEFLFRKRRWLTWYRSEIIKIRDQQLAFRNPNNVHAAFSSDLFSSQDRILIVRLLAAQLAALAKERRTIDEVAALMTSFCWQCLQTDLVRYRSFINTNLVPTIKQAIWQTFGGTARGIKATQLVTRLDQTVSARLQEFSTWFERSENSLMSVTIEELANVVLDEMRAYHTDFSPSLSLHGPMDTKIYGSIYHNLYDIFFILIGNAAEHGAKAGELDLTLTLTVEDGINVAHLVITSACACDRGASVALRRISEALDRDGLEDPMIAVRSSGLRKLRRIVKSEWEARGAPADGRLGAKRSAEAVTVFLALPYLSV